PWQANSNISRAARHVVGRRAQELFEQDQPRPAVVRQAERGREAGTLNARSKNCEIATSGEARRRVSKAKRGSAAERICREPASKRGCSWPRMLVIRLSPWTVSRTSR